MPLWDAQGALFFRDGQELWATDGTETGSRMVDGNYSYDDLFNFYAGPLAQAVGDRFYYSSGNDLRFASLAPLPAPAALSAQTAFAGVGTAPAVTLAWGGASPDAAGFIIERSTHSDFSTIDRSDFVPAGMLTYTDTSPTSAPAYYYRVRAIDAAGESPSSNMAITRFAVISGSVFNDVNYNGTLDPGEAGLAGVRVYIDANDSGHLGPNDVFAITDPSGSYVLGGLGPGYYTVREVLPVGFGQTAPETYSGIVSATLGQIVAGPLFGNVAFSTVPMDFSYLVTLARHYDQLGTFADGDLNGDGQINFDDLMLLARNYGHSFSPALPQAVEQTPAASIGHDLLPKRSRHVQRRGSTPANGLPFLLSAMIHS